MSMAGLPAYDRLYQTHYESPCGGKPSITVDSRRFETDTSLGGGLGILAVNLDGSFYAWRTDVVDDTPAIVSDQTIHYIDASGEQLGVARYPLDEWYFHLIKYLAIGPDGNAYALITRQNSVDILMLNFYRQLEPIQPDAAQPSIISGTFPPLTDSGCDCSLVQNLSPDSSEAQQITQECVSSDTRHWNSMCIQRSTNAGGSREG